MQGGFSNLAAAPGSNLFVVGGAIAPAPSPAFGGVPSPAFGGAPSPAFGGGASSVSFVEEPPKTFVHKNCNPESVSVMISVLQLVSLCGAEAVIPLAADRGLTHLCLRLSPFVHGVYEISDSRR
jgi:hypothetical protein